MDALDAFKINETVNVGMEENLYVITQGEDGFILADEPFLRGMVHDDVDSGTIDIIISCLNAGYRVNYEKGTLHAVRHSLPEVITIVLTEEIPF